MALHMADFMRDAVAIYRNLGFSRGTEHDLRASAILGLDPNGGDILVTAYRLDL